MATRYQVIQLAERDSVWVLTGFPTCWGVNTLMGQSGDQGESLGFARVINVVQTP